MVVDSSAVIAWIQAEPEADSIMVALVDAPLLFMSAFNVFETRRFFRGFPGAGFNQFEVFLQDLDVHILAFDANQAAMAFDAYQRFGRGSGHPAQLNLGIALRTRSPVL